MNSNILLDTENSVLLWDKELITPLFTSLKLAPGSAEHSQYINTPSSSYSEDHNASGIPLYQPSYPSSQLRCSYCITNFTIREKQIEHYSSDWHRTNLNRSIQGAIAVTLEQFNSGNYREEDEEEEEEEVDDNSDSDENEDEASSDEESVSLKRKPRIFFVNADQEIVSIFRTILQHKKTEINSETDLIHRANAALRKLYWVIILVAGGHFAGAVYIGAEVIAHKTFHSYTVRSKQGGSQSSRDNKSATSHPKSAGASLRRYNEQSFNQHIQELMEEWKEHIVKCDLIFCRCPKRNQLLFGGQNPLLSRQDFRLRTIPFPTKKPSFLEVKKAHRNLAQVLVHGKLENLVEMEKEKLSCKKSSPLRTSAQREVKTSKKLTKGELAELDTHQESPSPPSEEDLVYQLTTTFLTSNMSLLDPFGSSVEDEANLKKRRRKKKAHPTAEKSGIEEMIESSREMKRIENSLYSSCRTGDLGKLIEFVKFAAERDTTSVPDSLPNDVIEAVLSIDEAWDWKSVQFGTNQKTPLHVASENGHKDVIWWLLEAGCDPCVTNKQNETPYVATKVKESKNHFRRYMAEFPEKYDYQKANIPGPLRKEQESRQKAKQLEKKKQQKKVKQEKEKETKKEQGRKRQEEIEKEKFFNLSDREKRALAAEKRILAASQDLSVTRCFQCAVDISKIVPFEYCDFKFCSTTCVKEHRTKNKTH